MVVFTGKVYGILVLDKGNGVIAQLVVVSEAVVTHEDDNGVAPGVFEDRVDHLFRPLIGVVQIAEVGLKVVFVGGLVRGCHLPGVVVPVKIIWGMGDIKMAVDKAGVLMRG